MWLAVSALSLRSRKLGNVRCRSLEGWPISRSFDSMWVPQLGNVRKCRSLDGWPISRSFDSMWVPWQLAFPGLNELHCSLSIGGIPLLILATQETRCVGKSGGNSPVIEIHRVSKRMLTSWICSRLHAPILTGPTWAMARFYVSSLIKSQCASYGYFNILPPKLIPLSGNGTTCFSSCCDKDSAIILRPAACLTGRVLTTAITAGTNSLTCLPKHGGARDNKFWSPILWLAIETSA
jgi:hypothetical protein